MKNVFITGERGFIGTNLAKRAKLNGLNFISGVHEINEDAAFVSQFTTEKGVVIWFQSTKGLTAIDIDSAGSKMGASELSAHIAEVVMKQIRLRYISGAVFIDMPRLEKTDRKKFHRFCQDYALADIRHPDIYVYGPAGLVEMTIRHTYMPLIDRMNAMSSAI